MKALRAVNTKVLDAGAASDSTLGKWRMNFGLYFYAEPMEGPVSTPEAHGDAA